MARYSFRVSPICGVFIGAFAIVNGIGCSQKPTSAIHSKDDFVPNLDLFVPDPPIAPSYPSHPMPPNAVPFEFNGMRFYVLPLSNEGWA